MKTLFDEIIDSMKAENIVGSTHNTITFKFKDPELNNVRLRVKNETFLGNAKRRVEPIKRRLENTTSLNRQNHLLKFYQYNLDERMGQPIAHDDSLKTTLVISTDMDKSLDDIYKEIGKQLEKKLPNGEHRNAIDAHHLLYLTQVDNFSQSAWDEFVKNLKKIKEANLNPFITAHNIMTDGDRMELKPSGIERRAGENFKLRKQLNTLFKEIIKRKEHDPFKDNILQDEILEQCKSICKKLVTAYLHNNIKLKKNNPIFIKMKRLGFSNTEVDEITDKFDNIENKYTKSKSLRPKEITHISAVSVFSDMDIAKDRINKAVDYLRL